MRRNPYILGLKCPVRPFVSNPTNISYLCRSCSIDRMLGLSLHAQVQASSLGRLMSCCFSEVSRVYDMHSNTCKSTHQLNQLTVRITLSYTCATLLEMNISRRMLMRVISPSVQSDSTQPRSHGRRRSRIQINAGHPCKVDAQSLLGRSKCLTAHG